MSGMNVSKLREKILRLPTLSRCPFESPPMCSSQWRMPSHHRSVQTKLDATKTILTLLRILPANQSLAQGLLDLTTTSSTTHNRQRAASSCFIMCPCVCVDCRTIWLSTIIRIVFVQSEIRATTTLQTRCLFCFIGNKNVFFCFSSFLHCISSFLL